MHSLGDVWHPGSGVPCFGGFAAFAAFGGSQSHFLPYIFPIPYLHAFLRWRLASWLWGSLFRRFCSFCSLWGLTVSLSSLYLPYLTAFLRWRLASWLWGSLFCSFCSLWGLTVSLSSLYLPYFPIFMHSLGDVWHPGSGVPCFGGFAAFAAFGGSQSHFLPYIFPILLHSLGDVWHPGSGVPCFGGFATFAAFGGSQSHFLPYIFPIFMHSLGDAWHPYLNAFLRWRLASWLWGSLFRRFCSFCSLWGAHGGFAGFACFASLSSCIP